MTRLSESEKAAFRQVVKWIEPDEMRSPCVVEATPEARRRYVRWATEAAKFFKGKKPVRFVGDYWKL